jgi:hypothetical protein
MAQSHPPGDALGEAASVLTQPARTRLASPEVRQPGPGNHLCPVCCLGFCISQRFLWKKSSFLPAGRRQEGTVHAWAWMPRGTMWKGDKSLGSGVQPTEFESGI